MKQQFERSKNSCARSLSQGVTTGRHIAEIFPQNAEIEERRRISPWHNINYSTLKSLLSHSCSGLCLGFLISIICLLSGCESSDKSERPVVGRTGTTKAGRTGAGGSYTPAAKIQASTVVGGDSEGSFLMAPSPDGSDPERPRDKKKVSTQKELLSSGAQDAYAQGMNECMRGNYKNCIDLLADAVRLAPDNVDYRSNLAWAMFKNGDNESAINLYVELENVAPSDYLYKLNLGEIYLKTKEYDKSRRSLQRALAIDADLPRAYYLLGQMAINLQRFNDAETNLDKALSYDLEPHLAAEAHNLRAIARYMNGDPGAAITDFIAMEELGYSPNEEMLQEIKNAYDDQKRMIRDQKNRQNRQGRVF